MNRMECRSFSLNLERAIQHVKALIDKIPYEAPEKEAKDWLVERVEDFISHKIVYPIEIISRHVSIQF